MPWRQLRIDILQHLIGFLLDLEDFLFKVDVPVRRERHQYFDLFFEFSNWFFIVKSVSFSISFSVY